MSKITEINLNDLNDKLGTHEYEIVNISTKRCQPCQEMKKLMKEILDSKDFENVDIHVYVLEGSHHLIKRPELNLANKIIKKNRKFPMDVQDFLKILEEIFKSEDNDYWTPSRAMNSICDGIMFENKEGKIFMKDLSNPFFEFEVPYGPTSIFYHHGKPIEKPLNEKDYHSRGFDFYNEKYDDGIKDAVVLEDVVFGKKEKMIQINKKLDARIVEFNEKELPNILKKFVQL